MIDVALISNIGFRLIKNKLFWYSLVVAFAIGWYKYTSYRIDSLLKKSQDQAETIKLLNAGIDETLRRYALINSANKELEEQKDRSNRELEILKKVLYRENQGKKSLEELATKKTSLIQLKINKATEEVLKCFENISRDKPCED